MLILVLEKLFLEVLFDILYFPVWWYTRGLLYWGQRSLSLLAMGNDRLAPGIWLANIMVPMYGQYDWQGRIISFVMRVIQIFFRSIALFVWLALCAVVFMVWVGAPFVIGSGLLKALM